MHSFITATLRRTRPASTAPRVCSLALLILAVIVAAFWTVGCPAVATPAYSVLHTFNSYADCVKPVQYEGLLVASDGNIYGVTSGGGTNNEGTVYQLTPSGVLTTLHSFTDNGDDYSPTGTLIEGSDGYLYGVANSGGTYGDGVV